MFYWWLFAFVMGLIAIVLNKSQTRRIIKNYKGSPGLYGTKENLVKINRIAHIVIGSLFVILGILGMLDILPRR